MVVDLITYWNSTVHFTYMNLPIVDSCWPNSGPSSYETLMTIKGQFFDSDTTLVFGALQEFSLKPILVNSTHLVCAIPPQPPYPEG